jgi:hypothetical protein
MSVSVRETGRWIKSTNVIAMVLLRSVRRLLVVASVVPSSRILVTLMMEALRSSETSVTSQKTQFSIVTAVKTSNLTDT